mmetsp:Transcript_7994/g.35351  ORF Transcript_7994/g.35351 Transcript_7994/m.35351 type:complete len:206 (+) Transcript_7994:1206-1823(+)
MRGSLPRRRRRSRQPAHGLSRRRQHRDGVRRRHVRQGDRPDEPGFARSDPEADAGLLLLDQVQSRVRHVPLDRGGVFAHDGANRGIARDAQAEPRPDALLHAEEEALAVGGGPGGGRPGDAGSVRQEALWRSFPRLDEGAEEEGTGCPRRRILRHANRVQRRRSRPGRGAGAQPEGLGPRRGLFPRVRGVHDPHQARDAVHQHRR